MCFVVMLRDEIKKKVSINVMFFVGILRDKIKKKSIMYFCLNIVYWRM